MQQVCMPNWFFKDYISACNGINFTEAPSVVEFACNALMRLCGSTDTETDITYT